ncbi:SAM-dependent chlorinase/fluorinase [bacterium]|nr:SAM-dependent chlorinase/fluorinase [bacterium]
MSRGCITLLSDFGSTDPYVGATRGAALSVNPDVQLVDISHDVPPHDIADAGYVLAGAFRYFPAGTVHVAIVDPGVGSERRILAAEFGGHILMAPDNGLLSVVFRGEEPGRTISVSNADYFRHPVSMTFHGRDVFAPVAAHLTLGVPLEAMGPPVDDWKRVDVAMPAIEPGTVAGVVVHVDRFGNLVTNISREDIETLGTPCGDGLHVYIASEEISGVQRTYAEVSVGDLLAVIGSGGLLEISANLGSAADVLGVGRRTPVRVTCGLSS